MISAGRPDSVGGGGVVAEIFRDRHKPARFSGGGVVAEIFRDRHKPATFSGGGGVVAEIFRDRHKPATFSGGGGGVVAEIFRDHNKGQNFFSGNRRSRSLRSPSFITQITFIREHFFYISPRSANFQKFIPEKKHLPKVWGGGPRPERTVESS